MKSIFVSAFFNYSLSIFLTSLFLLHHHYFHKVNEAFVCVALYLSRRPTSRRQLDTTGRAVAAVSVSTTDRNESDVEDVLSNSRTVIGLVSMSHSCGARVVQHDGFFNDALRGDASCNFSVSVEP